MILQALVDYYEALAAKGKVTKPSFFENFCAKRQENSRIATEHIAAGSN